jgi:hypothetical protein
VRSPFAALVAVVLAGPAVAQEAAPAPSNDALSNEELQRRLSELEARFRALEAERGPSDPLAPVTTAPAEPPEADVAEVGSQGLAVELPLSIKLKINGHLRFRGEHRSPRDYRIPGQFGRPATESKDDGEDFVLQRTWLSFDFQVLEQLRAVVSVMDVRTWGDQPMGNDAAETFLREGYIEGQKLFDQPLSIKVGRTLVPSLGDTRLFMSLDPWANMPRLWDAVQVTYEPEGWWLYGFASNLREAQVQTPRGDENDDYWMSGVYASNRMVAKHELDAYLFWRHLSDDTQFTAEPRFGNGNFARPGDRKDFTAGARLKGSLLDELIGYTAEGVYQWGDQAGDPIRAWAAASTLSSTFGVAGTKVKLLGEYAFASGDQDPNDGVVETFDPLFPFAHFYHGHMDLILWKNLHAASAQLTVWPVKWLSLHADGHVFWLDKRQDAWYALNGRPTRRDASGRAGSHLGQELDLYVRVKLWEDRLLVWTGYSHFWTGEYLRETGKSEDQDWVFCHVQFNF